MTSGEKVMVDNPSKMPDKVKIDKISEPFVRASILVPSEYIGPIMELCQEKEEFIKLLNILMRLELIFTMSFLLLRLSMISLID